VIHQAEADLALGRPEAAMARYEALLVAHPDPLIEAAAFSVALRLGNENRATELFASAERRLEDAISQGEIYPLSALARLYAEAGVNLEKALVLARKNSEHDRERSAFSLVDLIERMISPCATDRQCARRPLAPRRPSK
jgi:hypothetical protein